MADIANIQEGDTGQLVREEILNPVIDIVNNLKGRPRLVVLRTS